jgi:ACS family glucarate transporter-like MFS transporter
MTSEVFGGYMLLTWLPTYLQTSRGLSVLNAGMLTSIPFGIAAIAAILLGGLSDKLLTQEARLAGRRRLLIAVMLICDAVILLVPMLDSLWAIVVVLTIARTAGAAGSAMNFALVTDLVHNRANIGKVTSITVLGGNTFGILGPIVTGYVVALTGSFNGSFVLAGVLALAGAVATLAMTRRPIEAASAPRVAVAPA